MTDRRPDAYHSLYVLAGLSSAQYRHSFVGDKIQAPIEAAHGWSAACPSGRDTRDDTDEIYDVEDKVNALHPIFVIPYEVDARCHAHYINKTGF